MYLSLGARKWFLSILLISTLCLGSVASSFAADTGLKMLHGHVPSVVTNLAPAGDLDPAQSLTLAIGLSLRDPKGLDDFLAQVYDPASPAYRQYLTPGQFTEKFGPTTNDYSSVLTFAKQHNLTVTGIHNNRMLVDVSGSVSNIQGAFHIHMRVYHHPTEARDFFAPDTDPSVDSSLPIADVSGLNNYVRPHPKSIRSDSHSHSSVTPHTGSGSGGTYAGGDFRAAYFPGVALSGAGQTLGLLEFDGFYASDLASYETKTGTPAVPIQTVLLDRYSGTPTTGSDSGNPEVSLDIEVAMAMAPGLSSIVVFEAGPRGHANDILNAMAASNQVKQLSSSWGWSGGPSTTTDNIFKEMAAQGQSFFNAAGDSDAFTSGSSSVNGVDNSSLDTTPSSSPYITQVGGTTLTTTGPGGAWSSEKVWNWGLTDGSYVGTCGGISSYYSIPSWQAGVSMNANGGSATHRNVPDVALTADNIFVTYGNGTSDSFGGTSCAAPLWAATAAMINQQALSNGNSTIGFINPAIYGIGGGAAYGSSFHDITTGNNTWSSSPSSFYAVTGYDLCTGWGTPAGDGLINALAGVPITNTNTNTTVVGIQSLVQNGGFETGDFTDWTLVGDTVNGMNIFDAVESISADPGVVHSGLYGSALGDNRLATLSQTLATTPGQTYLLSFWLDNLAAASVQQFLVNWNSDTLFDMTNPPAFSWTNLQFVVIATGSNTVLQFGAENDVSYFGLDDISVIPIPTVAFQGAAALSNGGFSLSWNTATGLNYQVQYTTDLSQSAWANLGSPVLGTGSTLSISDTNATAASPRRFYRLILTP
jgi:hypothetical protein